MSENHQQRNDESLKAPARLESAFKQLPQQKLFIPPTLDEAVLKAARRQLEGGEKRHATWIRYLPWWAGATGCLLLAAALAVYWDVLPRRMEGGVVIASEDVNGDGVVDILDAFALARQLQAGGTPALPEFNGDRELNERDIALVAAHAVKLDKGGSL